ncbi:MAG TPA: HAMP domain-containing sensor histidine kinase [Thermoanaerobaculia bacterium]|nr:HAMP domain-containing sensor histidine kinase [Thermoanaerobaculia bacterium]
MRPALGNRTLALILILLAVALGALAVLQYRWIDRTTEAERRTRKGHAEFVARRVADGLRREVQRAFDAFIGPADAPIDRHYEDWRREAEFPELIEAIYVADRDEYEDVWALQQMDLRTGAFAAASWTPRLVSMRQQFERVELHGPGERPPPLQTSAPALLIIMGPRRDYGLFQDTPRVVFVMLSREVLRSITTRVVASESGTLYDVSLVDRSEVLFSSSRDWPDATRVADASLVVPPLIAGRRGRPPRDDQERERGIPSWQVLVRHTGGGVDVLMASARRKNFAVSGAILLILIAAVAMLAVLVRRVERLREQESAFVRVMTHELNTPVAVLRSAGENLKDGIVEEEKVALYGATVVEEADRLHHMIGEVLELARLRTREGARELRTLAIAPVVEAAIERCRLLANGAVTIEAEIEPDLPPVAANDESLTRAIENLIVNAIRHGGSGEWVGVRVRRSRDRVCITVEDRGPGIAAEDARQLFQPFYRGRGSDHVSGAGLGLAIVREIAVAHGGSVTLERRDRGAAFTIQLPAAAVGRA